MKINYLYNIIHSVYLHKFNKNTKESKELTYLFFRNSLGVASLLILIFLFISSLCVFNLELNLADHRIKIYLIMAVIIPSYLFLTKRKLKPRFDNIELKKFSKKEINRNHIYYILSIIVLSLFGGFIYIISKLITINC